MFSKLLIALAAMGVGLSGTTWIQHAGVNAQTKPDRVCCADKHGKGYWDTTDPFCDGPDNLPCLSCCSGLSEDGGELGIIAEGHAERMIPRDVETVIARDRLCCAPQSGACYWDYTVPFCDEVGAVSANCCSTLSEDEHELNAIQTSLEAHTLSQRASTDHDGSQGHVEIIVARDQACCQREAGGCYWDYSSPFCEEPGTIVDESGSCCSSLAVDDVELGVNARGHVEANTPRHVESNIAHHVEAIVARDRACCQPKTGDAYWDYTVPFCDMPDTLPCGNCCSILSEEDDELGVNAQATVPRHVETLVARQHVCCDPQTGGNCYWDNTPPPCEQPGTAVDHSGACCSGLSKDDVELNAIIKKASREAYTLSQRASADAEIVKMDHIADTKPIEKARLGHGWLSRASDEGQVPAHAGGALIKKDDGGSKS